MKYGALLALIAFLFAVLAITRQGMYWLLLWPALSFSVVFDAYLWSGPSVFGKSSRGVLSPVKQILLLPYLLFAWSVWHVLRLCSREPAYDRLTDRLLIGRRLLSHELPAEVDHVADLTCEFNEPRALRERSYRSFSILDGAQVSPEQLRRWADEVAGLPGTVYIHCAQGHGRTGMFAAAVLLSSGEAATSEEALQRVTAARPGVRLSAEQRQTLSDAFATLYYTWELSLQPISAIWRDLRQSSLRTCWYWFPVILGRRLLKRRPYATYAVFRPVEFPAVPDDQLPRDARLAFIAFGNACQSLGFAHVRTIKLPNIGCRTRFVSYWLDATGTISCSINWTDWRLSDFRQTTTTFTCHSSTIDGRELHTIELAENDFAPELVPPGHEYVRLPKHTEPAAVVARHRERIAGRSDLLVFDAESLMPKVLRDFQSFLDFLVAGGGYARLTEAEVEYLKSIPQPGSAECDDTAK